MNLDLQGRVALVTGGSRGIGRAIALRLAQSGAAVAINYVRQATRASEVAAEVREAGGRALTVRANVADPGDLESMFQVLQSEFGRLDILISNAASGVLRWN